MRRKPQVPLIVSFTQEKKYFIGFSVVQTGWFANRKVRGAEGGSNPSGYPIDMTLASVRFWPVAAISGTQVFMRIRSGSVITRRHRMRNERATNWSSLTVSRSKYMQIRRPQDRRTATQRGVTGYDRRKRNRRASLNDAVAFAPTEPREYAALSAAYSDISKVRRR
jgi:hypothetical protein